MNKRGNNLKAGMGIYSYEYTFRRKKIGEYWIFNEYLIMGWSDIVDISMIYCMTITPPRQKYSMNKVLPIFFYQCTYYESEKEYVEDKGQFEEDME